MKELKTELKILKIAVKNKLTISEYLDFRTVISKLGYVKQVSRETILGD